MTYRVELTEEAKSDARQAYRWIAQTSPERAVRWYDGIEAAVARLDEMPGRCPLAPEDAFFPMEIRQLLYGRRPHAYRLLFEIREEEGAVYVLRILHGARDYWRPASDMDGEEE